MPIRRPLLKLKILTILPALRQQSTLLELFKTVRMLAQPQQICQFKPDQILCDKLAYFFQDKVKLIYDNLHSNRKVIGNDPQLKPAETPFQCQLTRFVTLNDTEVNKILLAISSGSPNDPCPPRVWHLASVQISKFLTPLLNQVLNTGIFPVIWKEACIRPILKKPALDPTVVKNYRPISCLPFAAKILEKAVNQQLMQYLESNKLLDPTQHDFRSCHSTETALIMVTEEIRRLVDRGGRAVLILLDLSAAFETVSHQVLERRLRSAGIGERALALLTSFLSNRQQSIHWESLKSGDFNIPCGVPQGSALSPTLFNIYVAPLVRSYGLVLVSYVDDSQIVISVTKQAVDSAHNFHACLSHIMEWMSQNYLKINTDKTEVMEVGNGPSVWNSAWWPSEAGQCPIPSAKVKNLGVVFDTQLNMAGQINTVTSACFFTLKLLRKIFPFISQDLRKSVVVALVLSWLDYCNALYIGIDKAQRLKLQSIQNAAARLLLDIPRGHSTSAAIRSLHWQPIQQRAEFKALCLIHKCVFGGGAPP